MTQDEKASLQEIVNNQQGWTCRKRLAEYLKTVEVDTGEQVMTGDQRRALHLWFSRVAETLNEAGLTVQEVLAKAIDVEWTPYRVKELLWRRAQVALFGKKSTTQLKKTGEIDQVFDHLNRHLGQEFGLSLPEFPHDPLKHTPRLAAHKDLQREDYPEMTEELKADKF